MTQLVQSLLERLAQLPEPVQTSPCRALPERIRRSEAQTEPQPRKRIAGLGQGTMVIADDFDEPLPMPFWLGEA